MPAKIKRPRPAIERVAAATMPINIAASNVSRKTTSAGPNMVLLRDDYAFRRFLIELADERVTPRRERPDEKWSFGLRRNDFLAIERVTVELLRCRILVIDDDFDFLVCRHPQFRRFEPVIADDERKFRVGGPSRESTPGE